MIALRQSLFRHRHAAMILLVLAFMLRALIPQGMMTTPDAARGITVLLCDGSGAATRLAVPLGEKPAKAPSDQTCPFTVLAQTGTADAPVGWTITPPKAPRLPQQRASESLAPARIHQTHPPARAPPVAA